tara:strand:- start:1668 stop:1781 length:114 start_codon:yes stop_codon:yes gene_type:complete
MSKGSQPRKGLDKKKYNQNWDKIFHKKSKKKSGGLVR